MRLSVGKKAPEGFGFAIRIGVYADDKGNCVFADNDSFYEFRHPRRRCRTRRRQRRRTPGSREEARVREAEHDGGHWRTVVTGAR
ncbi:LPXTG-motif cell wall anchor domain-containing protein [Streptomyces sp. HCCB10043]|nr:LPXTG-motif cell wall anchor domain-containing protein [Streptomyces sp. HCCB10043]